MKPMTDQEVLRYAADQAASYAKDFTPPDNRPSVGVMIFPKDQAELLAAFLRDVSVVLNDIADMYDNNG